MLDSAWLRYAPLVDAPEGPASNKEIWRKTCRNLVLIQAQNQNEALRVLEARKKVPQAEQPIETGSLLDHALGELKSGLLGYLRLQARIVLRRVPVDGRAGNPVDGVRPHKRWNTQDETFGFILPGGLESPGAGALILWGTTDRAVLYGAFHLLLAIGSGLVPQDLPSVSEPANALRVLDHWDNIDGSVERGYAGSSIFFSKGKLLSSPAGLKRLDAYARLLASVGINGVAINNVNVHERETRLITKEYLGDLARFAAVFRSWGISLFLSVNYAAPITLGSLAVADPLDHQVEDFWAGRAREVWAAIPDFGGFVVKADSEGRPGPFTYGRSHADGANMLARAVAPYGGIIFWRCFVYNCRQDWRDRKTDRARAAYDHFMPLDGQFADNVALQIKNGPMDFQVREPVSPLLGAMPRTNQVLELQITQEYTGQQRHLCCLLPQWKEVLDFRPSGDESLESMISGRTNKRPLGGMTAVANIGDAPNWTGHPLAQVNLYGFGRLAWDPGISSTGLIEHWASLTFLREPLVQKTLQTMLASSWQTYESYTAPLGVGWMVNPDHHYGPNVNGYEYSRWGTYHFADRDGIGVDRTVARGTGYTAQYKLPWSDRFEDLASCPDELLLFFHHVPWTFRLKSGKTVIQHIYDSHFDGLEQARAYLETWRSLKPWIDSSRHQDVLARLQEQADMAREWCDQINTYCWRFSGVPDLKGRAVY